MTFIDGIKLLLNKKLQSVEISEDVYADLVMLHLKFEDGLLLTISGKDLCQTIYQNDAFVITDQDLEIPYLISLKIIGENAQNNRKD